MVNFGSLAAEIISLVWGIPGNFASYFFVHISMHTTLCTP